MVIPARGHGRGERKGEKMDNLLIEKLLNALEIKDRGTIEIIRQSSEVTRLLCVLKPSLYEPDFLSFKRLHAKALLCTAEEAVSQLKLLKLVLEVVEEVLFLASPPSGDVVDDLTSQMEAATSAAAVSEVVAIGKDGE